MISLRFDPKLLKDLDALAESIGRNRSELLEEGARLVMAKHPSPKKPKPK
jgi:metal-responsive CopG/Arc/MetJ family transcriptional regulator